MDTGNTYAVVYDWPLMPETMKRVYKEDDWCILKKPEGGPWCSAYQLLHYCRNISIGWDPLSTQEIRNGECGYQYCHKQIPKKMLVLYKLLEMGEDARYR
jgi:hypothetical protein